MADWDEETTVVAMLRNEWVYARWLYFKIIVLTPLHFRHGDSKEDRLFALADNLKIPINAHGLALKQHLVQTLVPAAKKLKAIHATLETKVDVPFEAGLLAFNDASRAMENSAIREEDELKTAYAKSQVYFGLIHLSRQELMAYVRVE